MTTAASPRLVGYTVLAAVGLLTALASGRPVPAALAAPFAAILALSLARARPPELRIAFALDDDRMLEGRTIAAHLELDALTSVEWLELELLLPAGVTLAGGPGRLVTSVEAGEQRRFDFELACERWGAYRIGLVDVRARGAFGLLVHEARVDGRLTVRVYPRRERLRRLVRAQDTTPFAGSEVARAKGEGIEFADIRPFTPGDRVRRINWRASARRSELYVNESHPERASDVILFLDSFAEARGGSEGTIDQAVRAASSLANAYLERRNRVGLVSFGGTLHWLLPSMGARQFYRIVEALIETEVTRSFAWKDIDVIPRRILPPQALVIALTPLLDQRTIDALLDLRARGFDLVVVDVSPIPYTARGRDQLGDLGWRLWTMWRETLRHRYERVGVAVVTWSNDAPLVGAIEGVRAFRRRARFVSASR